MVTRRKASSSVSHALSDREVSSVEDECNSEDYSLAEVEQHMQSYEYSSEDNTAELSAIDDIIDSLNQDIGKIMKGLDGSPQSWDTLSITASLSELDTSPEMSLEDLHHQSGFPQQLSFPSRNPQPTRPLLRQQQQQQQQQVWEHSYSSPRHHQMQSRSPNNHTRTTPQAPPLATPRRNRRTHNNTTQTHRNTNNNTTPKRGCRSAHSAATNRISPNDPQNQQSTPVWEPMVIIKDQGFVITNSTPPRIRGAATAEAPVGNTKNRTLPTSTTRLHPTASNAATTPRPGTIPRTIPRTIPPLRTDPVRSTNPHHRPPAPTMPRKTTGRLHNARDPPGTTTYPKVLRSDGTEKVLSAVKTTSADKPSYSTGNTKPDAPQRPDPMEATQRLLSKETQTSATVSTNPILLPNDLPRPPQSNHRAEAPGKISREIHLTTSSVAVHQRDITTMENKTKGPQSSQSASVGVKLSTTRPLKRLPSLDPPGCRTNVVSGRLRAASFSRDREDTQSPKANEIVNKKQVGAVRPPISPLVRVKMAEPSTVAPLKDTELQGSSSWNSSSSTDASLNYEDLINPRTARAGQTLARNDKDSGGRSGCLKTSGKKNGGFRSKKGVSFDDSISEFRPTIQRGQGSLHVTKPTNERQECRSLRPHKTNPIVAQENNDSQGSSAEWYKDVTPELWDSIVKRANEGDPHYYSPEHSFADDQPDRQRKGGFRALFRGMSVMSLMATLSSNDGSAEEEEPPPPETEEKRLFKKIHTAVGDLVNADSFQLFIVVLILLNAIQLGVATFDFVSDDPSLTQAFEITDLIFLSIFTFELGLNFIYHGMRLFMDGWLLFDFIIIVASWSLDSVQIFRAFRIFRVLRLVTRVDILRNLILALFAVAPNMTAIIALLTIIIYIFAVMCTVLFADLHERGLTDENYFSRLDVTIMTLIQIMTLEGWTDVARQVMDVYPWAWSIFVSFVLTSGFIVYNLIIAVVCDSVAVIEKDSHPVQFTKTQDRVDSLQDRVEKMTHDQLEILDRLQNVLTKIEHPNNEEIETEFSNLTGFYSYTLASLDDDNSLGSNTAVRAG